MDPMTQLDQPRPLRVKPFPRRRFRIHSLFGHVPSLKPFSAAALCSIAPGAESNTVFLETSI
jgi:hypothetical protein